MRLQLVPLLVVLSVPYSTPTELCPSGCTCGAVNFGVDQTPGAEAWCNLERATLSVERKRNWCEVKCNKGDISCDTMPQFSYGKNASIDLKLTYCSLSSLECLPQRLQASSVRQLQLYVTTETNVTKQMVRGMDLETFFLYGDVDSNPLTFPREALSQFPKLQMLTINHANLTIHEGDLDVFSQLRMLEFTLTHLGKLPQGLFRGLGSLETLLLWGNDFEELPEGVMDGLSKLRLLSLENNRLRSLKFLSVASLPALKNITVHHNRLENLHRLSQHTNLTKLVVNSQDGDQPLLISPGALSDLPHLDTLSFVGSRIAAIPADTFRGSHAIREIDLANNMIESLPKGLFQDQHNLRSLRLDNNRLTELQPGVFDGLTALQTLSLDDNRLKALPVGLLSSLDSLRRFEAARNSLAAVPLGAVPRGVTHLVLDHNQLNFDFHNGDYRNIESFFPFNFLTDLQILSLHHNRITSLFDDAGPVLTKLYLLDLSYNNITEIMANQVNFLSNNITIDLRHNQISLLSLDDAPLENPNPEGGRVMLLDDNPLVCDCQLYHFAKRLHGKRSGATEPVFDVGNAQCVDPEPVKEKLVRTLPLGDFMCQIPEKYNCTSGCICRYRPHTKAIELDCFTEPKTYPANEELNATFTLKIRSAPASLALSMPHLRMLNLSGLGMDALPTGDVPKTVHELDLSNNSLSRIPVELLERNITLRLAANPYNCHCWYKSEISAVQQWHHKVLDWEQVLCSDGVPLRKLNPAQLCSAWLAAGVGGTLALLGLLIAIVASVLYIYSLEVRVWLHSRGCWFVPEEEIDKDKKYDAFVSFCHKDEQFVIGSLLPGLETGPHPYNICVHYRDWIPGEWIPAQIASSVDASRRTIIIVSKNFLDSLWGRLEFRAANMHAVQERKSRVIVVLLEDISSHKELDPELKAYLSTNTYLKWGDPWFWDRLRYAMPHKGAIKDKRSRKAEAKARKTGQKLAKQLAGAIDTQLRPDGKIINAAKDSAKIDIIRNKADVESLNMELAVPKVDVVLPTNNKETRSPVDVMLPKRQQFDIPRLPSDIVLQLDRDDLDQTPTRYDIGPRNLEDVVQRGHKVVQ